MKKYLTIFLLMLGFPLMVSAQTTVVVSGKVTDIKGEPLIGVNITVKNVPGLGAITDINGEYTIKVDSYNWLQFSYIGFESIEELIKEQRTVNVRMKEAAASILDEVVVTGLGTQKKLIVTGAITNVDVKELQRVSTPNFSNALAGQVAGLFTRQTSGQPGRSTSEFWIRGISTFGAGQGAYILVDGFEQSSLDDINIEDVESFTVLKDASATAIYGNKGANGVILVTTKRGKVGKVNIDVKVETSYNTRTITPGFVDGMTYANLANEAQITRNLGKLYRPEEIELIRSQVDPNLYPNVDWMDILLKDGAMTYRANLNLNGGGNMARYYVSASYIEEQGMYKTEQTLKDKYDSNANFHRWNYRMNVDMDITKTTLLKVGVSGSLDKQNQPGVEGAHIWGALFGYNALSTPLFYEQDGVKYTPALSEKSDTGDGRINPWTGATQTGYGEMWNNKLQTNVTLEQNLDFVTKGLKFTGRFGYSTNNFTQITHRMTPALYRATGRSQTTGKLNLDLTRERKDMEQTSRSTGSRSESLDLLLNWNRNFGSHNAGATLRYTQDIQKQTVDLGTDIKNSIAAHNQALAGEVVYNWNYRYFVNFNFGYSGSENFSDGNRYGFFPAFSLAWNLGEEAFIKNYVNWVDMFKLRFSYGKVGNANLGERFPYLYTIGGEYKEGNDTKKVPGYNFGFGSTADNYDGLRYLQVASNGVTWEVATKKDLGVDVSIFNERLSFSIDYYHEKRTGIYMERGFLPSITGLSSKPKANVGSVRTEGFDGNFAFRQNLGKVHAIIRSRTNRVKYNTEQNSPELPYS